MLTRRHLLSALLALTLLGASVTAQTATEGGGDAQPPAPAVTAAVTQTGARFTAPVGVSQVRLEIYATGGEVVYDSGMRVGSIIDWKPSDAQQALADGSYVCVLTVKDLRGRLSRRIGSVNIKAGQVSLGRARASELSAPQAQALDAARQSRKLESASSDDTITIVHEGKERAVTLATHDGRDGQLTSTAGALTLRTGDTLTGQDREQMRVTPEGRVGIGTDKPEATLDVAGTILARGGIVFADGSVLNSAAIAAATKQGVNATSETDTTSANIAGTGTTGKLALWSDGANGVLADSVISESNNNIGIGTTTPRAKLDLGLNGVLRVQGGVNASNVYPTAGQGFETAFATDLAAGGAPGAGTSVFQSFSRDAGVWRDLWIRGFNTAFDANGATAMYLKSNGNLGIGTTNPTQKLEVAGNIKLTGNGNGIVFPDGTVQTTAGAGGGSMSGTGIVNAINDAATVGVIGDNRLSPNVARLGGANAWSGANVFGAGLSANNALITNVGNPVNAGDAVNKAYADSNFVKFVPGAEQLSVGDANGTAPMINLRGGSTCCSGPGGHTPAWFKVFQNGSFVATGNLGIGVSPMQGKGYRTSWDSYKGAFRSGYADNEWDDATVGFFSWAGGSNSTAEGLYSLAFGDTNFARSTSSIAFGSGNEVKGAAGFSAGAGNRVCDTYGVAFGNKAQSGGPLINGKCDPDTFNIRGLAAVAIGYNVTADQDHTTAMGKFATNNGFTGTFIWSDGSAQQSADTFRNTANNEFAARATGGFRFRTNLGGTTGCNLPAGSGVFNCTSSRATKENFLVADGGDVLSRLRKIPVSTWNYITEGSQVRHIGPMAEDFYQQFKLGTGNTSIGVQDLAGVSLAAVKELDARTVELQQKTAEVERLRAEVEALRAANAAIEQRLAALEQKAR